MKQCANCGMLLDEKQFLYSHRLDRHPDGKQDFCKSCIASSIDIDNEETYMWVLEDADIPYIPYFWNQHKDSDAIKVIAKYFARMKLCSFRELRFEDTERVRDL